MAASFEELMKQLGTPQPPTPLAPEPGPAVVTPASATPAPTPVVGGFGDLLGALDPGLDSSKDRIVTDDGKSYASRDEMPWYKREAYDYEMAKTKDPSLEGAGNPGTEVLRMLRAVPDTLSGLGNLSGAISRNPGAQYALQQMGAPGLAAKTIMEGLEAGGEGVRAAEDAVLPAAAPGALGALESGAGQIGMMMVGGGATANLAKGLLGRELTNVELIKLGITGSLPAGVALEAGGMHDDATAYTTDQGDIDAATLLGGMVGTTDAIPVGNFVRKLNKATGGALLKKITEFGAAKEPGLAAEIVKGFLQEGAQEGGQQVAENWIAKDLVGYDPGRTLGENFWLSALTGGVLGSSTGAAINALHQGNRNEILRKLDEAYAANVADPINQIGGDFTPTQEITANDQDMAAQRDIITERATKFEAENTITPMLPDGTHDVDSAEILPNDPTYRAIPVDPYNGYMGEPALDGAGRPNPRTAYTYFKDKAIDLFLNPDAVHPETLAPLTVEQALENTDVVTLESQIYSPMIDQLSRGAESLKTSTEEIRARLQSTAPINANAKANLTSMLARESQDLLATMGQIKTLKEKQVMINSALRGIKEYTKVFQRVFTPNTKIVVMDRPQNPGDKAYGAMSLTNGAMLPSGKVADIATLYLDLDALATNAWGESKGQMPAATANRAKRLVFETLNHELGHIMYSGAKARMTITLADRFKQGTLGPEVLSALGEDHQDFLKNLHNVTIEQAAYLLKGPERGKQLATSAALDGTSQELASEGNFRSVLGAEKDMRYRLSIDEYMADAMARFVASGDAKIPMLNDFFAPAIQEYKDVYNMLPPEAKNQHGASFAAWMKHQMLQHRRTNLVESTKPKTVFAAVKGLVPGFDPKNYVGMREWQDKFSKLIRYGFNLIQLQQANPHIKELERYLTAVENWNAYRRSLAADTVEALEMWKNLGKGDAAKLSEIFVEEMDRKKTLTAQKFAEMSGGSPQIAAVYKRIRLSLNTILDEMLAVVETQTQQLYGENPEKLASELANVRKEFKNMKKAGYFPAVRFGNYTITVREGAKAANAPKRNTLNTQQQDELEGEIEEIDPEEKANQAYLQGKINEGYKLYSYAEDWDTMDEIYDTSVLFNELGQPTPENAYGTLYLTTAKNKDYYQPGKVISFTAYESEKDRNEALAGLKGRYGNERLYATSVMREAEYMIQGMPRSMLMSLKDKLKATGGLDENLEQVIDDAIDGASAYKDFRKHMLKKKGIDGYSEDLMRSYSHYMQAGAGHVARVKYADSIREPIATMQEQINLLSSVGRQNGSRQEIQQYLQRHMLYIMNPENELAALRGVGFMAFLGFNIKSAMVNLLQPLQVGYPYLASRYGDAASIKAMTSASWQVKDWVTKRSKYVAKTKEAEKSGKGLDDQMVRHTKMYAIGHHEGWIDQSLATELAIAASEDNLKRGWITMSRGKRFWYNASRYGAMPFHIAEKFNRYIMATAAYNLEYEKSKDHNKAVTAAKVANYSTNYENARWNRPEFMRGKKSVALLFANYLQNTLYFATHDKGAVRFALIMLVLAGTMGLPGADDADDLVSFTATSLNKLLGIKDPHVDLGQELREAIHELGVDPELIMHGISQNSFGLGQLGEMMGMPIPRFNVSSSLGLGDVIPGTDLLRKYGSPASLGDIAVSAAGASGNLVSDYYSALLSDSPDEWKNAEKLLPLMALRNVSKSARFAVRQGEYTAAGEKVATFSVQDPRERMELMGQALGFTPTQLSEGWESYMAEKEAVNFYKTTSSELQRQFNWAVMQEDREAKADTLKAISRYNLQVPYPEMRMTPKDIKSSAFSYVRQQMQAQHGVDAKKYMRLERAIQETYQPQASDTAGTPSTFPP